MSVLGRVAARAVAPDSGMDVRLEVDTRALNRLADKVKALGPRNPEIRKGLNQIGVKWIARIRANFRASLDPYGGQWPEITHRQGQPLIDTGRLLASIRYEVNQLDVELNSPLIYAQTHNLGLRGIKQRQFFPDKSRGLPKAWMADYQSILIKQIEQALDVK